MAEIPANKIAVIPTPSIATVMSFSFAFILTYLQFLTPHYFNNCAVRLSPQSQLKGFRGLRCQRGPEDRCQKNHITRPKKSNMPIQ